MQASCVITVNSMGSPCPIPEGQASPTGARFVGGARQCSCGLTGPASSSRSEGPAASHSRPGPLQLGPVQRCPPHPQPKAQLPQLTESTGISLLKNWPQAPLLHLSSLERIPPFFPLRPCLPAWAPSAQICLLSFPYCPCDVVHSVTQMRKISFAWSP